MKYIIFLITVLFVVSCQYISSKTETVSTEQIAVNSSVNYDDNKISAIRKIDFQNFTYSWTKTFGDKEKSFTLKNGISILADERRLSLQTVSFTPNEDKSIDCYKNR